MHEARAIGQEDELEAHWCQRIKRLRLLDLVGVSAGPIIGLRPAARGVVPCESDSEDFIVRRPADDEIAREGAFEVRVDFR